jgi:hypothetical protein
LAITFLEITLLDKGGSQPGFGMRLLFGNFWIFEQPEILLVRQKFAIAILG